MSFLDGLFKNGTLAADIATNDDLVVVNVDAAAPPEAGEVLTAIDGTHAVWSAPAGGGAAVPARALAHGEGGPTPGSINVGNSATPAVGNVLTALDAVSAGWFPPAAAIALKTAPGAVAIEDAAPPTAGQVLTAVDATHATWQAPPSPQGAVAGFAFAANAATLDVGSSINFAATNRLTGNSTITLNGGADGRYGTIIVQQDATGGRALAFTVSGRTVVRDLNVPDTNPLGTPNSRTLYQFYFVTLAGTPIVIILKLLLG